MQGTGDSHVPDGKRTREHVKSSVAPSEAPRSTGPAGRDGAGRDDAAKLPRTLRMPERKTPPRVQGGSAGIRGSKGWLRRLVLGCLPAMAGAQAGMHARVPATCFGNQVTQQMDADPWSGLAAPTLPVCGRLPDDSAEACWCALKSGQKLQLDAGLALAQAYGSNGVVPHEVAEALNNDIDIARDDLAASGCRRITAQNTTLYEYCCDAKSAMSAEWKARGGRFTRVALPDFDASRQGDVDEIVRRARHDLARGSNVRFHCAFPCTPWTLWSQLSSHRIPGFCARNLAARLRSRGLLRKFIVAIRKINRGYPALSSPQARVAGSFEWPAYCKGWDARECPEIKEITAMFPIKVGVDGCAHGLKSRLGLLLKKPWTLATSLPLLVSKLNGTCKGGHLHGETKGRDATMSSCYPPPMIKGLVDGHLTAPCGGKALALEAMVGARHTPSVKIPEVLPMGDDDGGHFEVLKRMVGKLHVNLGHPWNRTLARAVRTCGGSDEAVRLALAHKCPVSER